MTAALSASGLRAEVDATNAESEDELVHRKRTPLESVSLVSHDWCDILPFFENDVPDLAGAQSYIEATYGDYPVIIAQSRLAFECLRTIAEGKEPDMSAIRFVYVKPMLNFMIVTGQLAAAKVLVDASLKRWSAKRMEDVRLLMTGIETLRLPQLDHPWMDWQVFDRKADTTLILFCGAVGRFGIDNNILLLWLADLPCNIIIARDFCRALYLKGIKSLGPDKETAIDAIKAQLRELGGKRLVTAGNSGGVYAALHYGCLLNADRTLCFAGPTTLDAGFEEMEDRPVYERIARLIEEGSLQAPDLLADLGAAKRNIRYFHGADNVFDSAQAARLRGIPGASIEPLAGWGGHFVLGELARRGLFRDIWLDAVRG